MARFALGLGVCGFVIGYALLQAAGLAWAIIGLAALGLSWLALWTLPAVERGELARSRRELEHRYLVQGQLVAILSNGNEIVLPFLERLKFHRGILTLTYAGVASASGRVVAIRVQSADWITAEMPVRAVTSITRGSRLTVEQKVALTGEHVTSGAGK